MKKELIQEFAIRVTQANRTELIVIMYDIIEADLEHAKIALANNELGVFDKECRHVLIILNRLIGALDYRHKLAYDLLSLYSFLNKSIIKCLMKREDNLFSDIFAILDNLRSAFGEVGKQDATGPMMENTQQIYAGLTYGKGLLNEADVNSNNHKRGFLV